MGGFQFLRGTVGTDKGDIRYGLRGTLLFDYASTSVMTTLKLAVETADKARCLHLGASQGCYPRDIQALAVGESPAVAYSHQGSVCNLVLHEISFIQSGIHGYGCYHKIHLTFFIFGIYCNRSAFHYPAKYFGVGCGKNPIA